MEWLDKLEIKPTQPQLQLGLKLGLSLAIKLLTKLSYYFGVTQKSSSRLNDMNLLFYINEIAYLLIPSIHFHYIGAYCSIPYDVF